MPEEKGLEGLQGRLGHGREGAGSAAGANAGGVALLFRRPRTFSQRRRAIKP